jgi:hypothetical protein
VICVVVQVLVHAVLAVGLAPGPAPNSAGVRFDPTGGTAGTKQPDWQSAACELQLIMQFVVVEVCADAAPAPAAVKASTINHRMIAGLRICGPT